LSVTSAPAAGGTSVTIRGSGFQSGTTVTVGGKAANVTFKDASTLSIITPALAAGPQRLTITNPDGEAVSLDAALTAN
jgi:IPT/TIG domain